ncbi:MAG TPA: aldo/keto reductase, partial [Acidimicrobiales bacterium]|nr:aldo/keto reductase [Acidimicrobiales bacterium]
DVQTERSRTDEFGKRLYVEEDRSIVQAVANVAEKRGASRAQVALAWLLSKPVVSAPIVGVTKPQQLDDALGALSVELTPEEIEQLEDPYEPHAMAG